MSGLPASRAESDVAARRGFGTVLASTGLGQALALLAAPWLTRLYSPEDFGAFAVCSAFMACFGVVAAGRLDAAVPLPADDAQAVALVRLGIGVVAVSVAVTTLLLWMCGPEVARVVHQPQLGVLLPALPLLTAPLAAYNLLNQWSLRQRRFRPVARRAVVAGASTAVAQLAFGLCGLGGAGLVLGFSVGQGVGLLALLSTSGLRGWRGSTPLVGALVRYRAFLLVSTPSALLNSLGLFLPVVLFSAGWGASAAGYVGLAQRVLAVPVSLVGLAAAQVYLAELAHARRSRSGSELRLFVSASRRLALAGALLAVTVAALAPEAFAVAFGPGWSVSGHLARWLATLVAAQLVVTPVSQTLVVLERLGRQLSWDLLRLVCSGGAVAGSAALGLSLSTSVAVFAAAGTLAYLASWLLTWSTLRERRARVGLVWFESVAEGTAAGYHLRGTMLRLEDQGWRSRDLLVVASTRRGAGARLCGVVGRGLLLGLRCRVVVVRWHPAVVLVAWAWRALGVRPVFLVQGTAEDATAAHGRLFRLPLAGRTAVWSLRLASAWAAPHEGIAAWVADNLPQGSRVAVLPNGPPVLTEHSEDVARGPSAPPAVRLPRRYVVFAGSLAPWQGARVLADAVSAPPWPDDVELVVIGDGALEGELRAHAGGRAHLLGRQPPRVVRHALRGALASLSPKLLTEVTRRGISPFKLLEAALEGVPVIASRLPGQTEHVERFGCGLLVEPGSAHSLALAVSTLARDAELERRLRAGARRARAEASWERHAAELAALLSATDPRPPADRG